MGNSNSSSRSRSRSPSVRIQHTPSQPDPEAYKSHPPPPYPGLSLPSGNNLLAPNANNSQAGIQRSRSLDRPSSASNASTPPTSARPRPVSAVLEFPPSSRASFVPNTPISFPMPRIPSAPSGDVPGFIISPPFNPTDPPGTTSSKNVSPFTKRRSTEEDLLEMLRAFDTVVIVDDSSSMANDRSDPRSENRWNQARDALAGLFEVVAQYDADGIDIHFLNSKKLGQNVRSAKDVKRLFDSVHPRGITPIGQKLESLLRQYLALIERAHDEDQKLLSEGIEGRNLESIKPVNYIVLTDGAATDDPESVIVAAAKRLDARNFPLSQVGIQFVQIGTDKFATRFLRELDDELTSSHNIRDMVDTTPYSPDKGQLSPRDVIKVLIGGVNRRIDKKGVPST